MSFTTAHLLSAVQRRSFAPTGQTTFETPDILAIADEVMESFIVPDIQSVREEFFVVYKDYPITQGQSAYDIPARAIGTSIREIWVIDGTQINPTFPRIEPEQVTSGQTGTPESFYLRSNQIILNPTPASTAKTLRVFFPLRPGKFVETSAGAVIADIDTATNIVTVSVIPSTWATGNAFDLIKQDGGQEPLSTDLASDLVSGQSITLPSLPEGLRVGDYVALAGETPLLFLPPEFRPVLAQGVAAEILENMNQPGAGEARKKFDLMRESARKLITPRVQGEDRLIQPTNWF